MNIPANLRYTESHEWVALGGDTATVGITDHAQNELSDVVYVELPALGRQVAAGQPTAVVESVKAASDVYSPVSGIVSEINEALAEDPGLVNNSPYEKGWLFKVRMTNSKEIESLKDADAYASHVKD
jgi:glycine cleavage system H protein